MSNNINQPTSGLVLSNIVPREETYYLVTDDRLRNIKGKNILSDIFMWIASLFGGAFFSVLITRLISLNINQESLQILTVFQWVFLVASIFFLLFAVIFLRSTKNEIESITKTKLEIESTHESTNGD